MTNPSDSRPGLLKRAWRLLLNRPWWQRAVIAALAAAVLLGAFLLLRQLGAAKTVVKTAPVLRGELHAEITASGSLQARNTVQVGSQVSGIIERLFVDFNNRVRRGQLIALLDTTFLAAAVLDAQANLQKADAQLTLSLNARKRADTLFTQSLISASDQEIAAAQHLSALAGQNSARAQLERAKINLSYATVRSPIDGIVISRNIEVGQTVAASLNAPTLFVIADDLSLMQISALVDEGDIGRVAVGQAVRFTVDAYPDKSFEGTVRKIYLQPSVVQNVVSYTTIIDVDNGELDLMPGMTANVTIITDMVEDALLVPVASLSFQPQTDGAAKGRAGQAGRTGPSARKGGSADSAGRAWGGPSGRADSSSGGWSRDRVFVMDKKLLRRVPVEVLLNNGTMVAVSGRLEEGDSVAVGYLSGAAKAASATRNPFQPQRQGRNRPPGGQSGPH